jgi:hypothetical protein
MKSTLITILNGYKIIGAILHELSHALAAVLLYPFGVRIKAVKIVVSEAVDGKQIMAGNVRVGSNSRVCTFLVTAAPVIVFWSLAIYFWFTNIFLYIIWAPVIANMLLSKQDVEIIKYCFGLKPVPDTTEIQELINNNLNKL